MPVDTAEVKRVAHLARIAVTDEEAEALRADLNAILKFVEQLNEVDVEGVAPLTSVVETRMRMREDVVDDGERATEVLHNAPGQRDGFFVVPKVIE